MLDKCAEERIIGDPREARAERLADRGEGLHPIRRHSPRRRFLIELGVRLAGDDPVERVGEPDRRQRGEVEPLGGEAAQVVDVRRQRQCGDLAEEVIVIEAAVLRTRLQRVLRVVVTPAKKLVLGCAEVLQAQSSPVRSRKRRKPLIASTSSRR
jgi:hypothetical protein